MSAHRMRSLAAALLVAAALVAAGCGGSSTATPTDTAAPTDAATTSPVTLLQPADAQALIADGDVEVLDVRTPSEYDEGHLEGATLIDFYEPDFAERIGELDRDTEYVVYCRSGNRSAQAVALMAEQGFTAVNDVDGGITAWQADGLPVSSP